MAETRADAILRLWWTTDLSQSEIADRAHTVPSHVSRTLVDNGIRTRATNADGYETCECGRGRIEFKGQCRKCAQARRYAKGEVRGYGYGFFPGGDPREFTPDPDTADVDSLRKWMMACVTGEMVNEAEGRAFGLGYFPDRVRIIPR